MHYKRKWKLRRERANMRIGKIESGAEYRIDEKFSNFLNFDSFLNWENSGSLLIFQVVKFWKFVDFPI